MQSDVEYIQTFCTYISEKAMESMFRVMAQNQTLGPPQITSNMVKSKHKH